MLLTRVLSALVGIPILLWSAYRGGFVFFVVVLLLILFGIKEYGFIMAKAGQRIIFLLLWLGGIISIATVEYAMNLMGVMIFLFLLLSYIIYLILYPKYKPQDLALTLLGLIYVVYGFAHLLLLRKLANGFFVVLFVFIIIWITDTGAYFVGTSIGKHKVTPLLSPKKSWEGLIGGVLLSVLAAFVLQLYWPAQFSKGLYYITPLISLSGQIGDFFESSLKRYANVKDSGNTIPGHGGVLDRFDSILWAAPLTYYFMLYLERLI